MKTVSVLVSLAILAGMLAMQAEAFAVEPSGFVGVPWGSNRTQSVQIMSRQGFARLPTNNAGEEVFNGMYDGMPCRLHLRFVDDSMVKGETSALGRMQTLEGARMLFETTVKHLTAKYGAPRNKGFNSQTGYAWADWSFGDGVRSHKTGIEAILFGDGAWFTDLGPGTYYYYTVSYTDETLASTLQRSLL